VAPHLHNFRRCHGRHELATIHLAQQRCHAPDKDLDNGPDKVDPVEQVKPSDRDNDRRWQDPVLVQCVQDLQHGHNKADLVDLVEDLVDLVVVDLALAHKVDPVVPLHIERKVGVLVDQAQVVDLRGALVDQAQAVADPEARVVPVVEALLLVHSEKGRRSRRSRSRRRLSAKRSTICKHLYWVEFASLVEMVRRSDSAAARRFRI